MTILYAGLAVGAVYALVASCYNLAFTTSGVLNFATAHTTMVGTFVAAWGLSSGGLPVVVVIGLCLVVGAGVGFMVELTAIAPLKSFRLGRSGAAMSGHAELVTTLGAATVITGIAFLIWGPEPLPVHLFIDDSRILAGVGEIRRSDLAVIITAIVVGLGLHVWTRRSRFGLASLAQTEDRDVAMLQGINVRFLSSMGFILAGALGSALGVVVGAKTFAVVSFALVLAIKGFVAVVLGGVGNQLGALAGGAILGIGEVATARWVGPDYQLIAVFAVFLAVLFIRPQGLFGAREGRTV